MQSFATGLLCFRQQDSAEAAVGVVNWRQSLLSRDKACENLLRRFLLNKFCLEAGPVCLASSNPALVLPCLF